MNKFNKKPLSVSTIPTIGVPLWVKVLGMQKYSTQHSVCRQKAQWSVPERHSLCPLSPHLETARPVGCLGSFLSLRTFCERIMLRMPYVYGGLNKWAYMTTVSLTKTEI